MIYSFILKVDALDLDDELVDALYEAGCDDGTIGTGPNGSTISFGRDAPSLVEAIGSAIRDVESTGLTVLGVDEHDLVSLREIAERSGYSYEYLRLLARGKRGPGDFPPLVRPEDKSSWQFYHWADVAPWLAERLGGEFDVERARVIALANALLEARRLARTTENAEALTTLFAA